MKKFTSLIGIVGLLLLGLWIHQADASVLGTAGEFNTFIFNDFSCSSDTEGRLAVGGNAVLSNYSVGDKLQPGQYDDILLVGGDLTFTNGRVYYGDIRVGGSADMPSYKVADGEFFVNAALPIDFAAEEANLKAFSTQLSQLGSNGTVELKWGGAYLSGDGKSALQVFQLPGDDILNAHTFNVSNIASGATVLFNISGSTAGLTNMSLSTLEPIRNKVLFNFYEATTLQLAGISVEGSVLAPFAQVDNAQGVIQGTMIAASWTGSMQQNHQPFTGEGLPEPATTSQSAPLEAIIELHDNKDSQYKITFISHEGNTWTYKVEELNGRDLSHWSLGIASCLEHIVSSSPSGAEIGKDGSSDDFLGIKWNVSDGFSSALFSFTLDGDYAEGTVPVLAKAGKKYATAEILGPDCDVVIETPPADPSCQMFLNDEAWDGDNSWDSAWNGQADEVTVIVQDLVEPVTYHWELWFPTDRSDATKKVDGELGNRKVYAQGSGEFTSDGTYTIVIDYPPEGSWGTPGSDGYGTFESHVNLWINTPCGDKAWDHWYKAPWEADLEITKSAPAEAEIGEQLTYLITVTNHGPVNAEVNDGRGVRVTDTLPDGVTLVSVTPSQGECDNTIACDLGALNYLESATIDVVVTVDEAGTLVNTATVAPERPTDPNAGNNTASVETVVEAPQVSTPPDVLLLGINDDQDRFEIFNSETKETTFPKPFEFVVEHGEKVRVEAQTVPDEIESLVYVGDGIYYGVQSYNKNQNPDGASQLYKFVLNHDATEITIEKVGEPFSGTDIDALEYGDNVLYAMDNEQDMLLTIDLNGNLLSMKSLEEFGLTKVEGLAYKDGLLFASDTDALIGDGWDPSAGGNYDANSSLFSLDVSSGLDALTLESITYIGQIGYGQVEGLTFVDDILYGTSDLHDSLFSIDVGTGFSTFIETWGTDIEGIAGVYPGGFAAVPEPGTLILVGLGVFGIGLLGRRRTRR